MKTLLLLSVLLFTFTFSFSQNSEDPFKMDNESMSLIKKDFPKIYSVIVKEAYTNSPKTYDEEINDQCFAFGLYIVLLYAENPIIPKDVLTDIQVKALTKTCKNFTANKECDKITDLIKKADCTLSYMRIDWVKAIIEINDQINAYQEINN